MKIELIDTDEIIGLICSVTGNRILWDDESIEDALCGSVVSAIITSLYPEECGFAWMPLAASWNRHYASANTRKMTLDEVVEAFPASGKALKVIGGGMACGWITNATYFIVPEEFPDEWLIHAEFEDDSEANDK